MTTEERNQKIALMITRTGWSSKAFESMSDERVEIEYNRIMEEQS